MSRSNKKNNSAFSLIEIIVSIGILTMAFISISYVFPLGMNTSNSSGRSTIASYLAQEKQEELVSSGYDNIATGTIEIKHRMSSDKDEYLYDYYREAEASYMDGELNPTTTNTGLKRIKVIVYYPDTSSHSQGSFEISTLLSKR